MNATTGPRTFTSTVEANHAAELRAKRDRSEDDIDNARRTWEGRAMESAVADVLDQAREAAWTTLTTEGGDLDGASITVTISDLVATATLTLPVGSPS